MSGRFRECGRGHRWQNHDLLKTIGHFKNLKTNICSYVHCFVWLNCMNQLIPPVCFLLSISSVSPFYEMATVKEQTLNSICIDTSSTLSHEPLQHGTAPLLLVHLQRSHIAQRISSSPSRQLTRMCSKTGVQAREQVKVPWRSWNKTKMRSLELVECLDNTLTMTGLNNEVKLISR